MLGLMMKYGTDAAQRGWHNRPAPMAADPKFMAVHLIIGLITWVLIVAVLVALVRWLWFKGDQERRPRR